MWRAICTASLAFGLMVGTMACFAKSEDDVEQTVCGTIKEPLMFSLWSSAAGKPDPEVVARMPNVGPITHKTKDGRILKGYQLKGQSPGSARKGFLLVAQGNAMLADQLLPALNGIVTHGIDVFIFDFRGYGESEGKRRLKAIVSDYRELFETISAATPGVRLLYGISFGGVIMLNVIGSGVSFDRAVIDSTPSRVSTLGCPATYDPVNNLPNDSSRLLLIAGQRDRVVPSKDSQAKHSQLPFVVSSIDPTPFPPSGSAR